MNRLLLPLVVVALVVAAVVVARKADEQDAQLDRIEAAAGSCVVTIDAPDCPSPTAANDVRVAIAETGFDALQVGGRTVLAQPGVSALERDWSSYIDVLLGPDSLADTQVCTGWAAGTPCPDSQACAASTTPAHFLCRCSGPGISRRNGLRVIDGLFLTWRGADASACPPAAHNGCGIILTMTRAQYHVVRAIATDDDTTAYPAGIKALIDAMRADPQRTRRLADVPACLRGSLSVRAGRSDLNPPAAED